MPKTASIRDFATAYLHNTAALMCGIPSVPFAIGAAFIKEENAKAAIWLLAATCFFLSAYFVWKKERRAIVVLEEKLSDAANLADQAAAIREQVAESKRQFDLLHPGLSKDPLPPEPASEFEIKFVGVAPQDRLTLREAARYAYEQNQLNAVGGLVDKMYPLPEERLEYFIYGMLLHREPRFRFQGLSPPATATPREIDPEEQRQLIPVRGTSNLRLHAHGRLTAPSYLDVTISRIDLDAYVSYLKRIGEVPLDSSPPERAGDVNIVGGTFKAGDGGISGQGGNLTIKGGDGWRSGSDR